MKKTNTTNESSKKDFKRNTNGKANKFAKNKKNFRDSKDSDIRSRDAQSMNDISWYAMSEQLLRDTSSFPYAWMTGLAMRQARSYNYTDNYVIPGIIAANLTLSPLTLNNAADPVNVAARQITGYIRSFNSGAKNYDANDLMIRILAEGNFLSALSWATRIYATINMYSAYNKYMPRDLLRVQRVDPDDLRSNMATFRAGLNTIISKAASVIYVPSNLPLFKRWAWLFANYYSDSQNPKDQVYMLKPTGFSKFEIDSETSMGKLQYYSLTEYIDEDYLKADEILYMLNDLLEPLVEDQELCIMNGDMMKAYGASNIGFTLIPDTLTAVPVHDPLVLQQFKCARTLPADEDNTDWRSIVQDEDAAYLTRANDIVLLNKWDCTFLHNETDTIAYDIDAYTGFEDYYGLWADAILDSPNPTPTAVDNMENTRLLDMPITPNVDHTAPTFQMQEWTAGSEVVEYFEVAVREFYSDRYYLRVVPFRTNIYGVVLPQSVDLIAPNVNNYHYLHEEMANNLLAWLVSFDYAPTIYKNTLVVTYNEDESRYEIGWNQHAHNPFMRISNFAMLSSTTLEKMNNCALLSMFNITGFQPK